MRKLAQHEGRVLVRINVLESVGALDLRSEGRVADLNAVMHVAILDDFAHDALMSVAEEMRLEGLHDLDFVAHTHSLVCLQVFVHSSGETGVLEDWLGKLKLWGRRNRWQRLFFYQLPDFRVVHADEVLLRGSVLTAGEEARLDTVLRQ